MARGHVDNKIETLDYMLTLITSWGEHFKRSSKNWWHFDSHPNFY